MHSDLLHFAAVSWVICPHQHHPAPFASPTCHGAAALHHPPCPDGGFWMSLSITNILVSAGAMAGPPAKGMSMFLALWAVLVSSRLALLLGAPLHQLLLLPLQLWRKSLLPPPPQKKHTHPHTTTLTPPLPPSPPTLPAPPMSTDFPALDLHPQRHAHAVLALPHSYHPVLLAGGRAVQPQSGSPCRSLRLSGGGHRLLWWVVGAGLPGLRVPPSATVQLPKWFDLPWLLCPPPPVPH